MMMTIELTEFDCFIAAKYLNNHAGCIQFLKVVNRVAYGHNQCFLRAAKIEDMACISARVRRTAQKKLEEAGYISVQERYIEGRRVPNMVRRMPVSREMLQDYIDHAYVIGGENTYKIRHEDGTPVGKWHETMLADDVPDVMYANPRPIDRQAMRRRAMYKPSAPAHEKRKVFGSDDTIVCENNEPLRDAPPSRHRNHPPDENVGTRIYKMEDSKNCSNSGQALVTTKRRKQAGSDAAPPRRKKGFVSDRLRRSEDVEVGKSENASASGSSQPKKSEQRTAYPSKHAHAPDVTQRELRDSVTRDPSESKTYLLSSIDDTDERIEMYRELKDREDMQRYKEIIELHCFLYELVKEAGQNVREVKPLPAYAGSLARMKGQITRLGGYDTVKSYLEWLVSNGGTRKLAEHNFQDISMFAVYANNAFNEFRRYMNGDSREQVASISFERKMALQDGEWGDSSRYDDPDDVFIDLSD